MCLGLESSFNNIETDPAHSVTREMFKTRLQQMLKIIRQKRKHITRDNNKPLTISDEIRTLFLSSSESNQHKMIAMLAFDYKNAQVSMLPCHLCKCVIMVPKSKRPESIFCEGCKKIRRSTDDISSLLEHNLLPLWKRNDEFQYELPEELIGLTLGEKLCIQKYQGNTYDTFNFC